MTKEIILSNGQVTLVSDEDYEYLNQWEWHPLKGTNTYYAYRSKVVDGKSNITRMHQEVLKHQGILVNEEIDHKDRNGLNNQRDNLESVSRAVNQQRGGVRKDNTSGIKGIDYHITNNRWIARLQINKQRINVGSFRTLEEAEKALLEAKERMNYGKTKLPTASNEV